ncbi:MAG TPA: DUF4412 domain-containing protein, partial [Candidatus Bathyarchaeia archaeon]|nr:DUF4412 domain-containing protein [Candidatus Bathyarchaeia archaeon]
ASALAAPVFAGVEITSETLGLGRAEASGSSPSNTAGAPVEARPGQAGQAGSEAPRPGRILLDGDRMRVETDAGATREGKPFVIIFLADQGKEILLDDTDRSYVEIDRAAMSQVKSQIDAALAQAKAEMAKMPPAQRAEMEKLLAANAPAGRSAPPAVEVKPTGQSDKVSGFACRVVDVMQGTRKTAEACVADWSTVGLVPADVAALRKATELSADLLSGVAGPAAQRNDSFGLLGKLDGLPVRVRSSGEGGREVETRVVKIEKRDIDAKLFAPPAGYTRKSLAQK